MGRNRTARSRGNPIDDRDSFFPADAHPMMPKRYFKICQSTYDREKCTFNQSFDRHIHILTICSDEPRP